MREVSVSFTISTQVYLRETEENVEQAVCPLDSTIIIPILSNRDGGKCGLGFPSDHIAHRYRRKEIS